MARELTPDDWKRIGRAAYRLDDPVEWSAARGLWRGGEQIVEQQLDFCLLDATVEEVIIEGLKHMDPKRRISLWGVLEVADMVRAALDAGRGFSIARFGDGELFAMAQGTLLSVAEVQQAFARLPRTGVNFGDFEAGGQLAASFPDADILGVPISRFMSYSPMFLRLARHYGWPIHTRRMSASVINYMLYEHTDLYQTLLRQHKVLLVGNRASELAENLKDRGFPPVVGCVAVSGMAAVPAVLQEIDSYEYDVALVAAASPACLICPALGKKGKVAIDFGHLADQLLEPRRNLAL
jgi:hypothetical protein